MKLLRAQLWFGVLPMAALTLAHLLTPKPQLYPEVGFSSGVYDRSGKLLRLALANDERYRLKLAFEDFSPELVNATLVYEDRHFYSHPGVNPGALLRAAWSTYVAGERMVGGSTITMQLARMRFAINSQSVGGKLQQIARALQLERHYSKREILTAYLNLAPYGGNIEGVGAASLILFDKPARGLSLAESLALAVIPQNPIKRYPVTSQGLQQMQQARARLLELWSAEFHLSEVAREQFSLPLNIKSTRDLPYRAPHFSRRALASLPANKQFTKTTIDWTTQQAIQNRVKNYIGRKRGQGLENASAMLLDHRNMEVLASIGSASFFNNNIEGRVDGTTAKRSPGSTLKPFVYGMAIDRGIIHPMSLLKDAPKRFAAYTPENFDRGFMGPIVAQDALVYSRNVPAIELLSRVGYREFHDFLLRGQVAGLKSSDHYGLAAILGGNELTMEELVTLYAMLANHGELRAPRSIQGAGASFSQRRLLSPEASFLILDALRKNPRPDALQLESSRRSIPVAWKTGTSYAFRDAWTVGVFGPYVLAVWVGNFDGSGNPALVGRKAAAPLFFEIADYLTADMSGRYQRAEPAPGLNLRKVEVCASTGDLPGRHCPQTAQTWFVPGVSPINVSRVHRAIRIDNATGQRSCSFDPTTTHEKVFEFWPSDISRLLRQAGIAIRTPPPWSQDCSLDLQAAQGLRPKITSPSTGLTYHVGRQASADKQLALTASTDSDVSWLYWFANDSFIGKAPRNETLFWQPPAGRHTLLAVDDLGRSTSQELVVNAPFEDV